MIYHITHENIFKFILKFCFPFEISSSAIFPIMKISKVPLSPSFSSPIDIEKFQFPPDFVEFKNPVFPLHKWEGEKLLCDTSVSHSYKRNHLCKYQKHFDRKQFSYKVVLDSAFMMPLKVQSCKLYNNKYMIALTQITNSEIFAFISVQVIEP